jgi:L-seryl-tRNA(Ser) seleniumtransferase
VLASGQVGALLERYRRIFVVDAVRLALDEVRQGLLQSKDVPEREPLLERVISRVVAIAEAWQQPSLRRAINATGVVLHTGLGRAPLPAAAVQALQAAAGYANLEFDLSSGKRGERVLHVEELVCAASGAEAVAVVNNNAAAVLIALNVLAQGREAVISRGQLVEIGGSFRMPDVIAASGAQMREVGTTNRTHLRDYEQALSEKTGAILVVHPSNYRVCGFTAEVEIEGLAELAQRAQVPLIYDLGGGVLYDLAQFSLPSEPVVRTELEKGADLVTFSGDKVLGGPQAGIIAGRRNYVEAIRNHALMRVLRCDKLIYAALEATFSLYRLENGALTQALPVLRMLCAPIGELEARATRLLQALGAEAVEVLSAEVVESQSQAGSGALPLEELPSRAVVLRPPSGGAEALARQLRLAAVPIVGRIVRERLLLDMRTVVDGDVEEIAVALRAAAVA